MALKWVGEPAVLREKLLTKFLEFTRQLGESILGTDSAKGCIFFHHWSKWYDLEGGVGCYQPQQRDCVDCSQSQNRKILFKHC